jgi:hypothetical protein
MIKELIEQIVEAADFEVSKCVNDHKFFESDRFYPAVTINPLEKTCQAWVTVIDSECPISRSTKDFAESSTLEGSLKELLKMVKGDPVVNKQIYASTQALIKAAEKHRR